MAKSIMTAYGVAPPEPQGTRTSLALLFGALLAAPLAWGAQLLVNYGLASHACFPSDPPRPSPIRGWEWAPPATVAINFAGLAIAVAAAFVSFTIWRRLREETARRPERAYDIDHGRTSFFAAWGLWAGVWFALQILFATIAVFWAPPCGS